MHFLTFINPAPEFLRAEVTTLLIVAVGAALLARLLFREKDSQPLSTDKPSTSSTRGSFVPLVIGDRLVGPVILWVGDRTVVVEEEEAEGGKGFGFLAPSKVKTNVSYEAAFHALCVGPAARIRGIYVSGVLIPNSQNINSRLAPSGCSISLEGYGTLRIYWGEDDQVVDPRTLSVIGIATRMPRLCYVVWDKFRIGGSNWPIIEYVVSVPGNMTVGPFSPQQIAGGVNPASVVWQVLTAPFPHGGGVPASQIDFAALSNVSAICASEGLGMNILVNDGDSVDRVVSDVMQDAGLMLPVVGGVLSFLPVRKALATPPTLDNDVLLPPFAEVEKLQTSAGFGTQLIYRHPDALQKYKFATIDVDDDAVSSIRNNRRTKQITLTTITSRTVASAVVARRQVEDLDEPTRVTVRGARNLREATPGQMFTLPGVGAVRLLGVKPSFDGPEVELDLLRDPFNQDIVPFADPSLPVIAPEGDLEPDIRFNVYEIPFLLANGTGAVAIFRIRDNPSIFNAGALLSADGLTYSVEGTQSAPSTGGLLLHPWPPTPLNRDYIYWFEDGPEITVDENGDEFVVPLNLSATPASWLSGSQIMVLGGELLFVREFVQISGFHWQAKGVLRGRAGTGHSRLRSMVDDPMSVHPVNEEAYLIPFNKMTILVSPLTETAGVRFAKSVPVNNIGTLPPGAVIPDPIQMESQATRTPPLAWLTYGGDRGSVGPCRRDLIYSTTPIQGAVEGLAFEWLPVAKTGGAGGQGYGQPAAPAAAGGNFIIEVCWDPTFSEISFEALLPQTTYTVTAASTLDPIRGVHRWVYTAAMRVTDGTNSGLSDGIESNPYNIWEFRVYHSDGTQSLPTRARPRHISTPTFMVPGA